MREIVLTPRALDDILAAKLWYEERRPGLGSSFERSIEAALMRMQRLPLSFPDLAPPFRRAIVKRFP